MVTITLDEITLNAARAALDERAERLDTKVGYLQAVADVVSEDALRELAWSVDAWHDTMRARDVFAEADRIPVADAAYWTWTSGELVAGFGK